MTAASAPGPREVVARALGHKEYCDALDTRDWIDNTCDCNVTERADAILAALDLPALLAHERAEGAREALRAAAERLATPGTLWWGDMYPMGSYYGAIVRESETDRGTPLLAWLRVRADAPLANNQEHP